MAAELRWFDKRRNAYCYMDLPEGYTIYSAEPTLEAVIREIEQFKSGLEGPWDHGVNRIIQRLREAFAAPARETD